MHTCRAKSRRDVRAWVCKTTKRPQLPHLDGVKAVKAKVIPEVRNRGELRLVNLLKILQHREHTVRRLRAVQEGLRVTGEARQSNAVKRVRDATMGKKSQP